MSLNFTHSEALLRKCHATFKNPTSEILNPRALEVYDFIGDVLEGLLVFTFYNILWDYLGQNMTGVSYNQRFSKECIQLRFTTHIA